MTKVECNILWDIPVPWIIHVKLVEQFFIIFNVCVTQCMRLKLSWLN